MAASPAGVADASRGQDCAAPLAQLERLIEASP